MKLSNASLLNAKACFNSFLTVICCGALLLGTGVSAAQTSAPSAQTVPPAPPEPPTPTPPTPPTPPVPPVPVPPASSPAAAASAPRPAASTPAAAPGSPRPFAEVIRDATRRDGLFAVWTKDDKVWLEIKPEQLDQLYFFQVNLNQGLMSNALSARRMYRGQIVSFKKVGVSVQLLARNFRNRAPAGSPHALAVAQNSSDSLVGSAVIASLPHPERKSLLIEMNGILLSDLTSITTYFDAVHRAGYALDGRNSSIDMSQVKPDLVTFTTKLHFAIGKLPAPPAVPSPAPQPMLVTDAPDARSFFLGMFVSLSKVPEVPMRARAADGRVGHFNTPAWEFGNEQSDEPRRWLVNRWRLEKQDPSATLSEPKKPITYWLDKNVPLEYRAAVTAGVLEWNKAFERIGFKNALVVKQQSNEDDFDTDDPHHASIRWTVDYSDGALAVGPSNIDPRSGEILDADIGVSHGWTRLPRFLTRYQFRQPTGTASVGASMAGHLVGNHAHGDASHVAKTLHIGTNPASADLCSYGREALEEAYFGLDLLTLRGEIEPGSPAVDAIVKATLKDVISHEVGHTLGLRHNFRASTIYTLDKLKDPAFTKANGMGGSVMDYNGWNIALNREKQGEYVMSTLGPYDYWAIEYAYKELPEAVEKAALAAIAAKGVDPLLAYATDEDSSGDGDGMDPSVNTRDLGSDPLAFAERRVALSRELIKRLQTQPMQDGQSYGILLQQLRSAYRNMMVALEHASKYVGGITYVRDYTGTQRAPLTPVAAEQQRRALKIVNDTLFASTGLDVPPELAARLVPDSLERGYAPNFDIRPSDALLAMQRAALDRLYSDQVAGRIGGAASKLSAGTATLRLSEVYDRVQANVWAELKAGGEIATARRALQREHLRRVTYALLKPSAAGNADARALNRMNAGELLAQIRGARGRSGLSREAQAHLAESQSLLEEALKATLTRAG